jgi:hypothetical protein
LGKGCLKRLDTFTVPHEGAQAAGRIHPTKNNAPRSERLSIANRFIWVVACIGAMSSYGPNPQVMPVDESFEWR